MGPNGIGYKRIFHHSLKFAVYQLVFTVFLTLPVGLLSIFFGEKHLVAGDALRSVCDQPLAFFLVVAGSLCLACLVAALLHIYATMRLRGVYRTYGTAQLGYPLSGAGIAAVKTDITWLTTWKDIIAATNVLRLFLRLCVLVWTIVGSVWTFSSETCQSTASELYWFSVVAISYWYLSIVIWTVVEIMIFNGWQCCFISVPVKDLLFVLSGSSEVKDRGGSEVSTPANVTSGKNANSNESSSWGSSYWDSDTLSSTDDAAAAVSIVIEHTFYKKQFPVRTHCNVCRTSLGGSGLCCELCFYSVHPSCKVKADKACKRSSVARITRGAAATKHHWVEGNCPTAVETVCIVCFKSAASSKKLEHFRCIWCHATCHNGCKELVPEPCSLGMHRSMVIPPSSIVLRHGADSEKNGARFCIFPHVNCTTPLLVFVNKKSGGLQGEFLMRKFKRLLNPLQVFDLGEGGPEPGLRAFSHMKNYRVLGCGGDGTIGWILSKLDDMEESLDGYIPPVGVLPLGTGNDLARALGWGPGYEAENMTQILSRVGKASVTDLDRWNIHLQPRGSEKDIRVVKMNNYVSIGVDAGLTLEFHEQREAHPEKFNSRLRNKSHYATIGANGIFCGKAQPLHGILELFADGKKIDLAGRQGIIVLNLFSYSAGCNPWGPRPSKPWVKAAYNDGLLEVLTVSSAFHIARMQSNSRMVGGAYRVAQCKEVEIVWLNTSNEDVPIQVDGEPWRQPPSVVKITHLKKSKMLIPSGPLL